MRISDELKAHLHHGAHELRQSQQLLTTALDRIHTAFDEIQFCNGRADLIGPAIHTLNRQIHSLNEEMDRVYALRNDESDSSLKQENAQLKRDLAAVQQALRLEVEQHQAQLTDSVKSNEELVQRIQSLEQFNSLLISKVNEMREKYESMIIEVTDLKSTPAFNVIANTMPSSDSNGDTSTGPIPFGKTVVETNRGLTVTIESSRDNSPEKASLHHDWIPQLPSGAAVPFPEIVPRPQFTSPTPANGGSTEVAIRTPGRPKARAIVKGTQEANESFERMMRTLTSSPSGNFTNIVNIDNNAPAASSSSVSGPAMPIIRPSAVNPMTPAKVNFKLNPAVEAFTPSNSSSKDSAKSGGMQASSPSKNELKPSVTTSTSKEDGFIPPHLRRFPKISIQEEPVTTTEELSVKDNVKDHGTVATSSQNESTQEAEPLQATSLTPRILPHLRCLTNAIKKEDVHPSHVQRSGSSKDKESTLRGTEILSRESALIGMKESVKAATTPGAFVRPDPGLQAWLDSQEKAHSSNASTHESASMNNDTLIEINADDSPKAGEKKTVPLPPGFTPISAKESPIKTETASPTKTDGATSPTAANDRATHRNPTVEVKSAAPGHEASARATSERENNAAFVTEYNRKLSLVSEKYGRDSRKGSEAKEEDGVDPIKYGGADPSYIPPKPTGTRDIGALLDDECYRMVLKPHAAVEVAADAGREWKAVNKNGKVVYVL